MPAARLSLAQLERLRARTCPYEAFASGRQVVTISPDEFHALLDAAIREAERDEAMPPGDTGDPTS